TPARSPEQRGGGPRGAQAAVVLTDRDTVRRDIHGPVEGRARVLEAPAPDRSGDTAEGEPAPRECTLPFRELVEQIPAITYTEVDDPGSPTGSRVVYLSPQVEPILGYTRAEL